MGSSAKDPKLQLGSLKLTTSEDFKQVRDRIMLFVFSNAPQLDSDAIKRVNAALIDTIVALVDPATPNGKLMMAMMSSALKDPKKMTVWQDHSPASTTALPNTDRAKIGWAAGVPISRPLHMLCCWHSGLTRLGAWTRVRSVRMQLWWACCLLKGATSLWRCTLRRRGPGFKSFTSALMAMSVNSWAFLCCLLSGRLPRPLRWGPCPRLQRATRRSGCRPACGWTRPT